MKEIIPSYNSYLLEAENIDKMTVMYKDINAVTDKCIEDVTDILKSKGYRRNKSKASATADWSFYKGDGPDAFKNSRLSHDYDIYALSGWHGDDRRYGMGRIVMTVFKESANQKFKLEEVMFFEMNGEKEAIAVSNQSDRFGIRYTPEFFEAYKKFLDDVVKYFKTIK
jgi:hypothetical protein